jgi:glycosyltransferase involved in cell wall biosynthesis
MEKPSIICLTPVKNEAWILDRFLKCASLWADYIIIADQMSTDGSREIAVKYPKVILIDNPSVEFNEPERQKLLLNKVRQIETNGQKKLIIALDADEFLTANFHESVEWETLLKAPIGTIFYFSLINIKPNFKEYWRKDYFAWGFMDDEISGHEGSLIHSKRIPIPQNATKFICEDIKVLHYQYTDWQRMQSKHRWYQCFEIINRPNFHPLSIFRMYHHMYALRKSDVHELPLEWFAFYEDNGINMRSIHREDVYYWDKQVEDYFEKHGTAPFAALNIWQNPSDKFPDPRNFRQKIIHHYLSWSQLYYYWKFPIGTLIRYMDKCLKWLF